MTEPGEPRARHDLSLPLISCYKAKVAVAVVPAGPRSMANWSATCPITHRPWLYWAAHGAAWPGTRVRVPADSGRPVVADLAGKDPVGGPQPQAAVPGAVPHGVGGQFVGRGYYVVDPAWRQPCRGGVRADRRPQREQRAGIEVLLQGRQAGRYAALPG